MEDNDNDASGSEIAASASDDQSSSSADSSSSSFAFTWLRNFDDLENFHTDILEADHPLDLIDLCGDRTWNVYISPFGRYWSADRQRWVEEGEEEDETRDEDGGEREEARRNIGDPATRHNKKELRRCFNLLLEILSHFQYRAVEFHFEFDDDGQLFFFGAADEETKEQSSEEKTTTQAAIDVVNLVFDGGLHRSTDTDLPFLKWLELHQGISMRMNVPWQFFLDQGQISDNAIFNTKHLKMGLQDQLDLTALRKVLDKERFPNLENIEINPEGSEQRNLGGLVHQLGTFPFLSTLRIFQRSEHTTLSLPASACISLPRLDALSLFGIGFASKAVMRAFVDGIIETGTLITQIDFGRCVLPEEEILYLLTKASKLRNLRSLSIIAKTPTPLANFEALQSAYRQCNKESTSLQFLHVVLNDTFWIGLGDPITDIISSEATHYWKLNISGRRAIHDLPSISPPGLVAVLLEKANRAYQENGIYHMLREHADLRTIVADRNGISEDKQRQSNKKQKV